MLVPLAAQARDLPVHDLCRDAPRCARAAAYDRTVQVASSLTRVPRRRLSGASRASRLKRTFALFAGEFREPKSRSVRRLRGGPLNRSTNVQRLTRASRSSWNGVPAPSHRGCGSKPPMSMKSLSPRGRRREEEHPLPQCSSMACPFEPSSRSRRGTARRDCRRQPACKHL